MRKLAVLAALLAPALFRPVYARAADRTLVAQVEKMLNDDEKSILAALLTHPDLSAQFDADAALALKDPKNLHPFLGVWRAKFETFAESDAHHPNPDLDAHYGRYTDLMSGEMFAFLERSLPLMSEDKRNEVIGYLKSIDAELKQDGRLGNGLFDFTRKMVVGILDEYRKHLTAYAASPLAQDAKRDVAADTAAFAAVRKADDEARRAAEKPAPKSAPKSEIAANRPPVIEPPPAPERTAPPSAPETPGVETSVDSGGTGARAQLDHAAAAGSNGGRVMDGGGASRETDAVVVAPSGSGPAHPTLPPSASGSSLTAPLPPVPPPAADSRADSLLGLQTKPANPPAARKLKVAGGLLGALLGALVGFFVGGPVGAIAGAAIGAGLGSMAAGKIVKRLLH